MTGARSKIAEPAAKPSAGSTTAAVATAPAVCDGAHHEAAARDRLTLERAGDVAVGGVLGTWLLASLGQGAPNAIARPRSGRRAAVPDGIDQAPRHRRLAAWWSGAGPPATAAAPASQTASARAGSPSACACAHSAITSASSATASRSPSAARRSSPSAYRRSPASSARSGSSGPHDAAGGVVLEVALADRLDEQRVRRRRGRRRRRRAAAGRRRRGRSRPAGRPRRAAPRRAGPARS